MDEQKLPQVTNAELIADLEASLLELRCRLNNYLDLGVDDVIAADEGFNFAGQLLATLAEAPERGFSRWARLDSNQGPTDSELAAEPRAAETRRDLSLLTRRFRFGGFDLI
jgi:hypothetical protein